MKFLNKYIFFLLLYHLVFAFISYQYVLRNNGDSTLYWWLNPTIENYNHFTFKNFGTYIVILLNYPLVKIGIPLWGGFFIYAIIGFLGIFYFYITLKKLSESSTFLKKYYILELFFLLPNLHFWTATLGKEAIIFTSISLTLYSFIEKKYKILIIPLLVIAAIRPHVFFMALISLLLLILFSKRITLKKKIYYSLVFTVLATIFLNIILLTTRIKHIDFERITKFNKKSLLSFEHANSYVPMLDYNWFYKYFTFLFRPLYLDSNSLFGLICSLENSIHLVLFLMGITSLFYFKKSKLYSFTIFFLIFTVVCTFFYVQRYACFGIFIRTKIMFQPFLEGFFLLSISNWTNEKQQTL